MRNREFYEEELRSLDSIDTSSEAIRRDCRKIRSKWRGKARSSTWNRKSTKTILGIRRRKKERNKW